VRFDLLTIFPEFFEAPLRTSILGRALEAGRIDVRAHDIRAWATDKHHCTDDAPYGGGGGMVMLAEPLLAAIRAVRAESAEATGQQPRVIHLSPQGRVLTREVVAELAAGPPLVLVSSSYEGIDERVAELEIDEELSIGDYVLTGGELPALVVLNAVARRIPGVLGNPASAVNDSFENGLLDCPHYTRPETVEDMSVPPVLIGGHHANIERWRRDQSLERTARRRPDLLARAELSKDDLRFLRERGLWPLPENE
jgi:tRNA (guanine37-N1)-methyltransferase